MGLKDWKKYKIIVTMIDNEDDELFNEVIKINSINNSAAKLKTRKILKDYKKIEYKQDRVYLQLFEDNDSEDLILEATKKLRWQK